MTMRVITGDIVPWPAGSLRALQVRVRHHARALGIEVLSGVLSIADEAIE